MCCLFQPVKVQGVLRQCCLFQPVKVHVVFFDHVQITKYAFSGGQDTKEDHRRLGGNTEVDVSYQYLSFLLDDDQRLAQIKQVGISKQFTCTGALGRFTWPCGTPSSRRMRVVRC